MTSPLLAGSTILLLQAVLFGLEVTHAFAARLSGNPEGSDQSDPPLPKYGNYAYGKRCGCSYTVPYLEQNDCCADGLLCDPGARTCRVAVGEACKEKTLSLSNRKCAREAYGPQKDLIHCGTESCCIESIPKPLQIQVNMWKSSSCTSQSMDASVHAVAASSKSKKSMANTTHSVQNTRIRNLSRSRRSSREWLDGAEGLSHL